MNKIDREALAGGSIDGCLRTSGEWLRTSRLRRLCSLYKLLHGRPGRKGGTKP